MGSRRNNRAIARVVAFGGAGVLVAAFAAAGIATAQSGGSTPKSATRQAAFADAAQQYGVPEDVLLAVSYNESRWEQHGGAPSTSGAYGPMALTDVPASALTDRGDGVSRKSSPTLHTLNTAAKLIGKPVSALKSNAATNILGGAALLAHYQKQLGLSSKSGAAGWYGAVARYAQSSTQAGARQFADDVYSTITSGASAHTQDGQRLSLAATPSVRPKTAELSKLGLRADRNAGMKPECPAKLDCDYIPAAYKQNSDDPGDYGDYDTANRPRDMKIDTIVLHDTEETYDDTVGTFTDPTSYVSAHYLVRSNDGHVTQFVPTKDVAWHAGNWYVNMHAVGIEQEGFAIQGATWFTEQMYHSTATLVQYLAAKYNIPLDRQHIIGHDNVPGPTSSSVAGMHWDPGPFWDWSHFMSLVGAPIQATGSAHSKIVTINPAFASNKQQVTDCEGNQPVAEQSSSFVWLRTEPDSTAPLFNDEGLNPSGTAGTTCASDWGDKASSGQQFVVADQYGDWTAIWYEGHKVWFENPHGSAAVHSSGYIVTPKDGEQSIPVYGQAYPESSAYPSDIPVQAISPLMYSIKAGQSYVYGGKADDDYYYAKTIDSSLPDDHTVVNGQDKYIRIQLGHRIAYVMASDVNVVPAS